MLLRIWRPGKPTTTLFTLTTQYIQKVSLKLKTCGYLKYKYTDEQVFSHAFLLT